MSYSGPNLGPAAKRLTNLHQSTEGLRLAVFMPTWVGDSCMATPTLNALRQQFPQAYLVGIMRPVIEELLAVERVAGGQPQADSLEWFDDRVLFEKKAHPSAASRMGMIRLIREQRLNAAILLTNSLWSAAVLKLAGVRTLVGYNRDGRGLFLSERVPVPKQEGRYKPIPAIDYYLKLAESVGCDVNDLRMSLPIGDEVKSWSAGQLAKLGISTEKPLLVLNSNSASGPGFLWPEDNVVQLARRIADELGWQVVLHCGPGEDVKCNAIAKRVKRQRVVSLGRLNSLPIALSKGVLSQADLVVSTDSGARHIAVALNRQVISLFGTIDPAWTTTYNVPEVQISSGGGAGIAGISAESVFNIVSDAASQLQAAA